MRQALCCSLLLLAVFALGCSGKGVYPVEGQVVWKDGSPATELAGSLIFFELAEERTSARGFIQPDASFRLETNKPNDGALLGEHVVTIVEVGRKSAGGPDSSAIAPAKLDSRYMSPATSDLRATVARGVNKITVTVERAGK